MTGMVKSSSGVLLSLDKPLYRKTDNHLGTFLTTSASRNKPNRHPVAAVDAMMAKMSAMSDASRRKRRAMAVPSFGSFGHLSGEEGTQYSVTAMLHYAASMFIALIWNAIFAELYALVVHVLPVSVWDVVSFTPQKTAAATTARNLPARATRRHSKTFDAVDASEAISTAIREALALERALRAKDAVAAYEAASEAHPRSAELRLRLAKAMSDTMYDEAIFAVPARARAVCERACEHSKATLDVLRRQLRTAPPSDARALMGALGKAHVVYAVNLGRLAGWLGPRKQVRLIEDIRAHASEAVRLSPDDDFAHLILGRWELEVAQVPGAVKTIAKLLGMRFLEQASLASALNHFRAATSLAPSRLIHHALLGKCLMAHATRASDRAEAESLRAQARDAFAAALSLPDIEDINAHYERLDAERLLKELGGALPSVAAPATETE